MDLLKNMGLMTESKEQQCSEHLQLRQVLTAYLHFQETLPPFMLNLLEAKCRTDLDIASNFHLQEAKRCRERIIELFESRCIHVRPQKSRQGGLEDRIRHELKDFGQIKVLPHRKCAIVQMSNTSDVPPAVNALRGPDFQYYVPSTVTPVSTASDPTKPIKTKQKFSIDPERLLRENMTSHLENMQYLELGDLLSQTLENTESE